MTLRNVHATEAIFDTTSIFTTYGKFSCARHAKFACALPAEKFWRRLRKYHDKKQYKTKISELV